MLQTLKGVCMPAGLQAWRASSCATDAGRHVSSKLGSALAQVTLSMSKELPVVVEYRISDIGHISCAHSTRLGAFGLGQDIPP